MKTVLMFLLDKVWMYQRLDILHLRYQVNRKPKIIKDFFVVRKQKYSITPFLNKYNT